MNKQKIYSEDGERVGFVYYLWIVFRLKIRKLIQKFKDFQSRRPHRSFKLTRHRDAVRQLKLPGYWEFTGSVWRAIKQNGRLGSNAIKNKYVINASVFFKITFILISFNIFHYFEEVKPCNASLYR